MSDPLTIIQGDALSSLRRLPDESVQTCVTSPPYWGLRSYGTEPVVWGNSNGCEHEWVDAAPRRNRWSDDCPNSPKQLSNVGTLYNASGGAFCACGAWRGELGLEPTPDLYVEHLVAIFREVRRVLRNDGTVWLNLGDSYCTTAPGTGMAGNSATSTLIRNSRLDKQDAERARNVRPLTPDGLKPKDLVGIPWRVAFALQADGWYLRSDIVWSKRNCMPESVRDRPTRSHEYIFLLSKSERYFYNADAIAEPIAESSIERISQPTFDRQTGGEKDYANGINPSRSTRRALENFARKQDATPHNDGDRWNENNDLGFKPNRKAWDQTMGSSGVSRDGLNRAQDRNPEALTRNKRTVWTITTQAFSEAHFATFPTEIPQTCILAGSRPGDVVIDPFSGSGTTAKIAIELGRKAIAIEPKAEYVEMIKRRCRTTIGLPLAI